MQVWVTCLLNSFVYYTDLKASKDAICLDCKLKRCAGQCHQPLQLSSWLPRCLIWLTVMQVWMTHLSNLFVYDIYLEDGGDVICLESKLVNWSARQVDHLSVAEISFVSLLNLLGLMVIQLGATSPMQPSEIYIEGGLRCCWICEWSLITGWVWHWPEANSFCMDHDGAFLALCLAEWASCTIQSHYVLV